MRRLWVCLGVLLCVTAAAPRRSAGSFSLGQVNWREWTKKGELSKVVGPKLYDLIDGFADIHMGFCYIDSEHLTIRKGKHELEVSVFRVDTPGNAYGLYSCLRDREGELLPIGDEASFAYGTAIAWRGSYCIEVKDISEEPAPREAVVEVTSGIAQSLTGKHEPPEMVRALPKEKLNYKGLIYFHQRHPLDHVYYVGTENVLLLGTDPMKVSAVEAVYAEYKLDRGGQGIVVLRYPKGDEASKALEQYTGSVRRDVTATSGEAPWQVLTIKNGKQTIVFQKDRLLIVALESSEPDAAKGIVEKIAKALEPKKKEEKRPGGG